MTNFSVGAQRPVHEHLPGGVETSEARDSVELAKIAGLALDEWQAWFLGESLRRRGDRWSAFECGLIVPRQNGKGALLEARQLAGLFITEEPLGVHTAHEFKTAYEHFIRISQLVESCADLDRKVMRVRRGAGEQAIELKNGCRLRFAARTTGSGRGWTGDTVYLDEAFALTTTMMGALLPTLSAVPNPQIWYTSSAPLLASTVLHDLRQRGRRGDVERLLYAEWGLDGDAVLDHPANWYRTNPALGIRIDEEFIRSEMAAMASMPEEFGRERLGIAETSEFFGPIALDRWDSLKDEESAASGRVQLALDVSPDQRWATFAIAGRRSDALGHVATRDRRKGTAWVLERGTELARGHSAQILIDPRSPAGAFIAEFTEAGVEVVQITGTEYAQSCGALVAAVENGKIRHRGTPELRSAIVNAAQRTLGDAWAWSRRNSSADITPLVAATLAWGRVPAESRAPVFAY